MKNLKETTSSLIKQPNEQDDKRNTIITEQLELLNTIEPLDNEERYDEELIDADCSQLLNSITFYIVFCLAITTSSNPIKIF